LALQGQVVEFIPKSNRHGESSPDVKIDSEKWEMKSPKGRKLTLVEKNLRRGSKQSDKIIFDSRRIKRLPDKAIMRELSAQLKFIAKIKKIKFVGRQGQVVDIEQILC
jgi:hypothetical protein